MIKVRSLTALLAAIAVSCLIAACSTGSSGDSGTGSTIVFDANGGTGSMAAIPASVGTAVSLTANTFTRTNYTFNGWNTVASPTVDVPGTAYADGASLVVYGTVVLYAQWTAKAGTYTITFDANGGTGTMADQAYEGGVSTNLNPNTFTYSGYAFAGWSRNAKATTETYKDGVKFCPSPPGNVTLYAVWSKSFISITYAGNGNTGGAVPAALTAVAAGASVSLDSGSTLVKTGYAFSAWNTAADGSGDARNGGASYNFWANTTLYAVWLPCVVYNANGATSGSVPASVGYVPGSLVTIIGNTGGLAKTGSIFLGWAELATATAAGFVDGTQITMPVAPYTLYAVWKYPTITFNANGGSGSMAAQSAAAGTVTLSANTFTNSGSAFAGWATSASATSVEYVDGASYTLSGDVTLYAVWKTAYALNATGPAGGRVFYDKGDYKSGWRYMEASPANVIVGVQWASAANGYSCGGTSLEIGTGKENTALIVAQLSAKGDTSLAAQLCDSYAVSNGGTSYDDWYLPSAKEMAAMYTYMASLTGIVATKGNVYWTSSEYSGAIVYAYSFYANTYATSHTSSTDTTLTHNKSNGGEYSVRAARRF